MGELSFSLGCGAREAAPSDETISGFDRRAAALDGLDRCSHALQVAVAHEGSTRLTHESSVAVANARSPQRGSGQPVPRIRVLFVSV